MTDKSRIGYYISKYTNPKVDKIVLVVEVLSNYSFSDLQVFQSRTPNLFKGLLKLPYLKRKTFSSIFKTGKALWHETVDPYGAISFIILNNDKEINHYLELKEKLDFATATHQYEDSYKLLKQIDNEVSVSMTGTYYLLKLTRLDKGITASTQLYNNIYKDNNILSYISNIAFKSASIDMPFETEIERLYQSLNGSDEVNDFITAFAFPFKNLKGEKWLRLLSLTSIIDLYEGFVLHLSKQSPDRLRDEHLSSLLGLLITRINDVRIKRINELINNGLIKGGGKEYAEEMDIFEKFYEGEYSTVVKKGTAFLKNHPLQSTIIDVVNRSCVKLEVLPSVVFSEDSLAEKVYNYSYFASTNKDISEICKAQLRNICMAWYVIPGMRHLYSIINGIETTRKGSIYHGFWNYSLAPEVRDACFYSNSAEAVSYLEASGYYHDSSAQIAILEGRKDDDYNQTRLLLKDLEDTDIPHLRTALTHSRIAPVLTGNIVSQLFDRLTEVSNYDEAIDLFVKFRLKNPYTKIIIDIQRIVCDMTDDADANIRNQLELSAFYTMINADVYKRYLAYKRNLKQLGVKKASEIENIKDPLLQFFIGKVADRSVLSLHVRQFETEDDVDAERIELCKKMYAISEDKSYAEETTSLIKEHEVRALAQQVNDSKIHVDVQPLINNEFESEKLLFDTYREIDENLVMFEQKNFEGLKDYLQKQYEGKTVIFRYEFPTVKYKKVLFHQMFLAVRDKFLFDPRYGLDKYLSARIRHGTLITQLRNHFLSYSLVTNKIEGGGYNKTSQWAQLGGSTLMDTTKERINDRLLKFTEWLDGQLRDVKEEKIQILTERIDGKKEGLFNYSEDLMADMIDELEDNTFETFEAFIYSAIGLLWKWTGLVLQQVRDFFQQYQKGVLEEMDRLQNDIVPLMAGNTALANRFKDAITTCRTDFQTDISVVTSWFKPEQSKVRYFTVQQAVDTSLSVINKINQNALSFSEVSIEDTMNYRGEFFNAFHDIFHDMMNNILGYEATRPNLKGKGKISIVHNKDVLFIEVSNPVDKADLENIQSILKEQQNFPLLIDGGKTRRDKNSGCVKIYSTVMYT